VVLGYHTKNVEEWQYHSSRKCQTSPIQGGGDQRGRRGKTEHDGGIMRRDWLNGFLESIQKKKRPPLGGVGEEMDSGAVRARGESGVIGR